MSDDVLFDKLEVISDAISLVEQRFNEIKSVEDFVSSDHGMLLLDAICMRLQVIGETVKKALSSHQEIFDQYGEVNWENIVRLRDLLSHHYDQVDHEIVYDICQNHIPVLRKAIHKLQINHKSSQ